jgi:hypothetical protein
VLLNEHAVPNNSRLSVQMSQPKKKMTGFLAFVFLCATAASAATIITPNPATTTFSFSQVWFFLPRSVFVSFPFFLFRSLPTCDVLKNLCRCMPCSFANLFQAAAANFRVWTTPITRRIRSTSTTVPTATGTQLNVYCAREELESFQVVIAPTSVASMTVSFAAFPGLAAGAWLEVAVASFSPVSPWGQGTWSVTDLTTAISSGASVPLSSTLPTVLIATVYVPTDTCGRTTYNTNFVLTPQGGSAVNIPVALYVFDVVLSVEPHLATNGESQPRFNTATGPLYNQSQLDAMYLVYGQHRMSGRSQSWPAGLNWGGNWLFFVSFEKFLIVLSVSWDSTTHQLIDMDGTTSTQVMSWRCCLSSCFSRKKYSGMHLGQRMRLQAVRARPVWRVARRALHCA